MKNLKSYLNNPYQVIGTRHYTLDTGKSKGVSAIDARTGSGLEFTVVKDRALDISMASFRGINLTYISRLGEVSPAFHDRGNLGWMNSFFGGLLTTCGPENIGKFCTVKGISYPQHGSFSNTPATDIQDASSIENGIDISGKLYFGMLGGTRLEVRRNIKSAAFSSKITVSDSVTNTGSESVPIMMLYHTNYGFPFLSEATTVHMNKTKTEPYDKYSEQNMDSMFSVSEPLAENREKNYFHYMPCEGNNEVKILNEKLDLGINICFSDTLPIVTQCKIERPGDYFMGIEPCNTLCIGREEITKRKILPHIEAGQTIVYRISFEILQGEKKYY